MKSSLHRLAAAASLCLTAFTLPAMAADYTIRLATIAQVGQPIDTAAKQFKDQVEKASEGRIEVSIYPGGQLGGEIEMQDNVAIGTIQMAVLGSPVTVGKLAKLDVLNMYYLWRDRDHMNAVLTGEIGQQLFKDYEEASGVHVIAANWQQGIRKTLLKRSAATPQEMNGIKIRVTAGVPVYDQLWSAMGASPVPLPFPDAYSAMQTGVVDGVELPLDFIANNGFQDLGKFLVETDHYVYSNFLIVNSDFFKQLPDELKKIVTDAGIAAGEHQTKLVLDQEAELLGKLKEAGVNIVEADQDALRQAVQPVADSKMDVWGRELYEAIIATPSN